MSRNPERSRWQGEELGIQRRLGEPGRVYSKHESKWGYSTVMNMGVGGCVGLHTSAHLRMNDSWPSLSCEGS